MNIIKRIKHKNNEPMMDVLYNLVYINTIPFICHVLIIVKPL